MGTRIGVIACACACVRLVACIGSDPSSSISVESDGGEAASDAADAADAPTVSISTLRNPRAPGHPALGAAVKVAGGVVTGIKTAGDTHGFFIQDPNAQAWGGIHVWVGNADVTVAKGDVVTVTGVYAVFRGFDELQTGGNPPVKTGTAAVPVPIVVPALDIAAGGARAQELQSMLLRVESVQVSKATYGVDFSVRPTGVTSGPELVVTSFIANDVGPSPFPATAGQTYASITGFGFEFGASDATAIPQLAPSSASDLQP